MTTKELANAPGEYTVDCIGYHVREAAVVKYVAQGYSCTPGDDTMEPPENIPEHSITRF